MVEFGPRELLGLDGDYGHAVLRCRRTPPRLVGAPPASSRTALGRQGCCAAPATRRPPTRSTRQRSRWRTATPSAPHSSAGATAARRGAPASKDQPRTPRRRATARWRPAIGCPGIVGSHDTLRSAPAPAAQASVSRRSRAVARFDDVEQRTEEPDKPLAALALAGRSGSPGHRGDERPFGRQRGTDRPLDRDRSVHAEGEVSDPVAAHATRLLSRMESRRLRCSRSLA
jgi:hypothetical protein